MKINFFVRTVTPKNSNSLMPAVGVPAVGVPAVGVPTIGVPARDSHVVKEVNRKIRSRKRQTPGSD